MHEAGVALRVLEAVLPYRGVRTVFVAVGRESCVRPRMLRTAFAAASARTSAEGAALVTVDSPGDDICVLSIEVCDDETKG